MGTQGVGREEKSWGLGGPTKATETLGTPQPCGAQPSHRSCLVFEALWVQGLPHCWPPTPACCSLGLFGV